MDVLTIRQRICTYYVESDSCIDVQTALKCIREDGSFDDVDYTCESRSRWRTSDHLKHTVALALAYEEGKDIKFARLANLALDYWRVHDFHNSNWWHNDLGVPQLLRKAALLLWDSLSDDNLAYVLSRLQEEIEPKWTGANKIWFAENVICRGVLSRNGTSIQKGKCYIEETAFISARGCEGIQPDYSFAQHGQQLYNHGYGFAYLGNITKWAYLLRDTAFAVEEKIVDMLTDYALQGSLKMCRCHRMDYQAQSREIVRGCIGLSGEMEVYVPVLDKLAVLQSDEHMKNMLLQARGHITEGKRMPDLEGNSMYYCLDFMTHTKEKYYTSVRWASREVLGGDAQNGVPVNLENLLDGFGAYGTCCYMVSGNEYKNIFPVWDWGHIPGTTTPHVELPIEIGAFQESTFVGGVSDGDHGVIAAEMHKMYTYDETASFAGKKASFLFENLIVHLGANIHTTSAHDLNTTYNQCLLNGTVYANGTPVKEKCFTGKIASVFHDGIAYYNLDGAHLALDTRSKCGSWYKIYGAESTPREIVEKDVFLLYRPHIKTDDSYAYAVMPGLTLDEYRQADVNDKINILSNGYVQAVYSTEDNKLGAVFHTSGSICGAGIRIDADAPCILLYDKNIKTLYISDPEQRNAQIQICIETDGVTRAVCVSMPTAPEDKGKTVKYTL